MKSLMFFSPLSEIAAINENLDNLNSVLDTIEQRADDMKVGLTWIMIYLK